jgi:hypothetical protein
MSADPARRYADAGALAQDVVRFQAGQPVVAYRESPLERAIAFGRKYRTPIVLVLAYLVMRAVVAWYSAVG